MITLLEYEYKGHRLPWTVYMIDYSEDVEALPDITEVAAGSVARCANGMQYILSPSGVWQFDASTYGGNADLVNTLNHVVYISQGTGTNLAVAIGATPITNGGIANSADSLTVTYAADTGYKDVACTINGTAATSSPATYTVPVGSNVEIASTATAEEYDLTLTVGENTTLTVADSAGNEYSDGDKIAHDTVLTVTASADTGYSVSTFTVGGVSKISTNPATHAVTGALTIVTAATIQSYVLTLTQGTNTTLTVLDGEAPVTTGTSVDYGTELTVTAAAGDDYDLTTFTIGGVSKLATNPTTHTMTAAVTIVTAATVVEE